MIHVTLSSQRKQKTEVAVENNVFYPTTYNQKNNLPQGEYLKRDRLIKKLAEACPYGFGDLVRPNDDAEFAKYGCYRVVAVCNSWYSYKGSVYKDDKDVQWSTNPRIVQAMNLFSGHTVEASTNFFRKANQKEALDAKNSSGC